MSLTNQNCNHGDIIGHIQRLLAIIRIRILYRSVYYFKRKKSKYTDYAFACKCVWVWNNYHITTKHILRVFDSRRLRRLFTPCNTTKVTEGSRHYNMRSFTICNIPIFKYYETDRIKTDKTATACDTHGRWTMCGNFSRKAHRKETTLKTEA
jgi:hypothetical protein